MRRNFMVLVLLAAAMAAMAAASSSSAVPAHGSGGIYKTPRACEIKGAGAACTKCTKKKSTCLACSTGPVDSRLVEGQCTCPPGAGRTNTPNTLAPPPKSKAAKTTANGKGKGKGKGKSAGGGGAATCSPCAPDYISEQQLVDTATCTPCPEGMTTNGVAGSVACDFPSVGGGGPTIVIAAGKLEYPGTGDPVPGDSGDGGPAREAKVAGPRGLAIMPDGTVVFADRGNNRLRAIGTDGIIRAFAGDGGWGYDPEDEYGPALSAKLREPQAVRVNKAGEVVFADTGNNRIRRVTSTGNIVTIAGTGKAASGGDGGPATSADLNEPTGIAFDNAGNMYIAEKMGRRVRKVDANGIITTFAGKGVSWEFGDYGKATEAGFKAPMSVAVDNGPGGPNNGLGIVYIGDGETHRIRRVDEFGFIYPLAGTGDYGSTGDNGDPKRATFQALWGMTVDHTGELIIADELKIREIRMPQADTLRVLAGTGEMYFENEDMPLDDVPAREAVLLSANDVAVAQDDTIWFTDGALVRKIVYED